MYLMNVPPVAATQTEWRTCGPPGGYSLPACFNDSDTELSTRGTPISDKVQMIIESLRCTQSSLEMGDEIEGNVLSGQEGHPQVCKGAYMGAKAQSKGPIENQQTDMSLPTNRDSSGSDSDDSVDRGIEEAIVEYLREKDGHKRKAEPPFDFLQSTKIPRKTPLAAEVSQQNSDSSAFFMASNQFPKDVKVETPVAPAAIPIKKYIKHKALMNDNTVKKFDSVLLREQTKSPSKPISSLDNVKCPVTIKVEEDDDSNDSSSDDGIEEAIQIYQLEKKEQQIKRETFNLHELSVESDSTSDDGIEEAIRHYQLEQLKEKSVLNPFINKQKPFSKPLMHSVGSTSTENTKKQKMRKKNIRMEREGKSVQSLPIFASTPKKALLESSKSKGNGLPFFKVEGFKDQPTLAPTPPKVNTTAELMCAEAILDISKTVIPGPFHQSIGLSACTPTDSSLADNCPDEESEGSSIDSEDGIEQEIRNFLEQKAQMHKQPSSSAVTTEPQTINEPEEVKGKEVASQKKLTKLSLTQRRKHKIEIRSISNMSGTDTNVKETPPHPPPPHLPPPPLPEQKKEPSPVGFSDKSQTHPITGVHVTEQSGEKSSSLDSDEDLDTAIKDLLKTKKKSKKKIRDLKRKPRKCLKEEEPLLGSVSQTKRFQLDPVSKRNALKKVQKSKDGMKDKSGLSKKNILQTKQTGKSKEQNLQEQETEKLNATMSEDTMLQLNTAHQIKEDSSSVDSDDSIEQEIRRFLAHKAKVSSEERGKDNDVSSNGTAVVCSPLKEEDIKQENQLAEIPRKSISPFSGQSHLSSQPLPTPQCLLSDISSVGSQSHLSSVHSCNPFLEPADGAGAARTEQRKPDAVRGQVQDVTPQTEKVKPELSPYLIHSRSEAMKWRQSLGLPATDPRTHSRTPCHVTSSKISETASATLPYQRGDIRMKSQTPASVWSSARTSRVPFSCSTETVVNTTERSPVLHVMSTARQYPRMPFARSVAPGHRVQCPIEGETKSMVHMLKDKSVFVELESNRTNHVQVRSRERSEGKERIELLSEKKREVESMKMNDKEVHLERTKEEFIDEADCELGNRRNPEKKQGFSTLSSAIDPGINFRPCIALTTEDRSTMFDRRYLDKKSKKEPPVQNKAVQNKAVQNKGVQNKAVQNKAVQNKAVQNKALQRVKRRLEFIPVDRGNEATTA